MLFALPSREQEDEASRAILKAVFREAMMGAPAVGLGMALQAIARGKLGHKWRPSPPELRMLIDKLVPPEVKPVEYEEPAPLTGGDLPISVADIDKQLERLIRAMSKPKGYDVEEQRGEYRRSMRGFKLAVVVETIDRVLDGRFERKTTVVPRVNELAQLVRRVQGEQNGRTDEKLTNGKLYRYASPKSKVLESNITKERASELCRNGVYPKDSIWCPGPVNDRPEYGDLFGPDPLWQKPIPIDYERQQHDDAPFEWLRKDALQRWKDFPIVEEHCTYERFYAHKGRWPIGATFVPALGQVRLNTRMPDAGKAVR